MKINNFYSNKPTYSPSSAQNKPSFKGYFACPIKELHFQTFNAYEKRYPIIKELQRKCGEYFKILVQSFDGVTDAAKAPSKKPKSPVAEERFHNHEWGQDNKLFTENGLLVLKNCADFGWKDATVLAKHLNLPTRDVEPYIEGGNCFLGKKPNGDTFALIGHDALVKKRYHGYDVGEINNIGKDKLAEALGLNPDNVHVIPQPAYHLDMAIRPLKYPDVLVDSRQLPFDFVRRPLTYLRRRFHECVSQGEYASPKKVARALEEQGFNPIFVPGSLNDDREALNYMNAVVHQKPDGSLVYITNHSSKGKGFLIGSNMEKVFTRDLQKQCPDISEIIFIDGKGAVEDCLKNKSAGIHCLTSERPDFEQWNRMLK